jgi:O-methyltransferase
MTATIARRSVKRVLSWMPVPVQRAVQALRWELYQREDWKFEWLPRREFFRNAMFAISFNGIDGDYAEFGCWGAMTFSLAYHEARRIGLDMRLWTFDSFGGLPAKRCVEDEHPRWSEGWMVMSLEQFHAVLDWRGVPRSAYEVVPGRYEVTLVPWPPQKTLPMNLCIAYIDCDLYSSTMEVLRFLLPRLKHGMIIAFDDYYCFSSTQPSGERRACIEAFDGNPDWLLVPYIQFGWHGMSFVVESRKLSAGSTLPQGNLWRSAQ